ncbi:MAG: ATP-grasp domain-containing protein [Pseudomonadota bacterium]
MLREILITEQADLFLPVSEEILHAAALVNELPEGVSYFGMPQEQLVRLHDKFAFNRLAGDIGLAAPETYLIGDPEAQALAERVDTIVKPVFGSCGRGVQRVARGKRLPATPGALVQMRIYGDPVCTMSIADRGRLLGTAIYRPVIEAGTVSVVFERINDPAGSINTWVEAFIAEARASGFISFDFIVDQDGQPFAIECNPRTNSGVHFFEPVDLAEAILRPGETDCVRLNGSMLGQQLFPCLTEALAAAPDWRRMARCFAALVRARDVSWSRSDPLPLLTMPFSASEILWRCLAKRERIADAATDDITLFDPRDGGEGYRPIA